MKNVFEKAKKEVKEILIEINDDFEAQKNKCNEILTHVGLTFREKKHSEISNNSPYKNIYNQIWIRNL